jgi:hypothetical protein
VVCPDYFLYSLCDHIYYRLPTDFDADAALIIRDPALFTQRVISNFQVQHPVGAAARAGHLLRLIPRL